MQWEKLSTLIHSKKVDKSSKTLCWNIFQQSYPHYPHRLNTQEAGKWVKDIGGDNSSRWLL
jgi:hypothetical protein